MRCVLRLSTCQPILYLRVPMGAITEGRNEHDPARLPFCATIEEGPMRSCRFNGRIAGRLGAAGVLPLLLCLAVHALANTPPTPKDSATKQALTLQSCRQIALQNQPSIAAAQASVKAAVDRAGASGESPRAHLPGSRSAHSPQTGCPGRGDRSGRRHASRGRDALRCHLQLPGGDFTPASKFASPTSRSVRDWRLWRRWWPIKRCGKNAAMSFWRST